MGRDPPAVPAAAGGRVRRQPAPLAVAGPRPGDLAGPAVAARRRTRRAAAGHRRAGAARVRPGRAPRDRGHHRRRDGLVRLRRHLADRRRPRRRQRPAAGCPGHRRALYAGPWLLWTLAQFDRSLLGPTRGAALAQRVDRLTETRTQVVDAQAAELRRIERDLHDGAQARIVVARHEPRAWPRTSSTRDPAAAQALHRRGPAGQRRSPSPSCGTWCAASTRRCSPSAASTARCGRWR